MKRALICLVVTFCAINFAHADPTIRSLQQTLKEQGFYYGAVTGEKAPRQLRRFGVTKFATDCE
jgi:hypothetical protein